MTGFSSQTLLHEIARLPRHRRILVAYSGGCDSTVLLHALASLKDQLECELWAIHVDHGLQVDSTQWAEHCRSTANALGAQFYSCRVNAQAMHGESREAAARHVRYAALRGFLETGDLLLTAHHQDDQAETILLQLLRGAGARGAAGIAPFESFGQGWLARPLLGFSRQELRFYAQHYDLFWIDDPSNFDTSFERNFLRQEVMPSLLRRWPGASVTLARTAEHQREAAQLLAELAAQDLEAVRHADGVTLSVSRLSELNAARQRNVLRHWLREHKLATPSAAQLQHVQVDVVGARQDRTPIVRWSGVEVRRYRDQLYAMTPLPFHDEGAIYDWDLSRELPLSALGKLGARAVLGQGVGRASLQNNSVTVRFRRGGEQCRPSGQAHHRELKKLFQERGIAPWQRDRVPLLYVGDQLAAVVGYWICEPFAAQSDEQGYVVEWLN